MRFTYLLILTASILIRPVFAQEARERIQFRQGTSVRLQNLINEKAGHPALQRLQYGNRQFVVLQFDRLPAATEKAAMARDQVQLFDYIPGRAFLAALPANTSPDMLKKYAVSGVFGMEPTQKISNKLNASLSNPDVLVAVSYYGNISQSAVVQELQAAGAQIVTTKIQPPNTLFVRASYPIVEKIAALPFVHYLSPQVLKSNPLNNTNRGVHGIEALSLPTGRNLQGQGIVIGIGDNGDPSTHMDLTGRIVGRTPLPPATHGTHVTGTAAGAGIINPRYKGMAPKSTVISQYYSDILVHTPAYRNDFGMLLTNNSYYTGLDYCPGNGEYDVLSNFVDNQLLAYPELMHVFAAGNDGGQHCSPYPLAYGTVKSGFQCAKNVLTVGGLNNASYSADAQASRGPVYDGRLKPEVVAGSASINSTRPYNGYGPSWGTSMASPTVTGALALLYERYRQLHGGANPPAALIKAAVCNGADDLGNAGPDFTFGFGSLNARNAVEILENNQYQIGSVDQGGSVNFSITGVPAGTHQIKILLYWPDVAGTPNAASALVNNLDLTVTAPGPSIHYPLILNPDPGHVNDLAVEGIDNVNNIEQVVINNPPAGNFQVSITGSNVSSGPQTFYVAYQVINPGVVLEHPFAGETWVPGESEFIRWHAYGGDGNTFTLEYSTDNGANWSPIITLPSDSRLYYWTIPNTPTVSAKVRVTRNNTAYSDENDQPFAIMEQPTITFNNVCRGYTELSWPSIPTATSYDVLMLRGSEMQLVTNTTATNYLVTGLNKDSGYYFAVRPLSGSTLGRQSAARRVTPSGGACNLAAFDNDFTPEIFTSPVSGRMHTLSQLGMEAIQVRIRNLDNVASSGSFNVSYQVNGGPVFTENRSDVIGAFGLYTHTFTQQYDFSATGTYTIKIWVDHVGDNQKANDTIVRVIKHLQNDPITLAPSFTEGFESADAAAYTIATLGLDGLDRCDFKASSENGRARTFVNSGLAHSGGRAITLDQKIFSNTPNADTLTTTFNLSSYNSSHQLWLDFYYRNQGIDFSLPGNRVWIRGSENDAWIPVYTMPANDPTHFGVYRAGTPVNITETLTNAVPAQAVSSSFQVRFGQEGYTSANNLTTNGNLDDGVTFDDITITNAINDVGIQALVSPNLTGICGLSINEVVQVRVKNYSNVAVNNVAVSYSVNAVTVNETIPVINAGEVLVYTFAQPANLAAFQQYELDAWVHYGPDNYRNNDSLLNIIFHTTPTITSYPYLQDFEGSNGYWYTAGIVSSWEWGPPSNTIINKAASGATAWVTSLTGNYNNSEHSFLYSPCFDLSGLAQPVFSFSHIFRMEDVCDCDFHWVEYSLDDVTWTRLGSATGGTNWYDHADSVAWQLSAMRWQVSSYDIPVTAPRVRFRFVMRADPFATFEGVGIDDVHIFDKAAVYTGADITSGLTQNVSGNDWVHFSSGGNRIVSIHPNGENLGSTAVKVYFNPTPHVRYSNTQYYLDRNIVVQPASAPTGNVRVRFYFTDAEADRLINASGCSYCTSLNDAYEAGVTQYSNALLEENGTLADNANGLFTYLTPALVDIKPYDNGYYAEHLVSNFSEFWINGGGPGQNEPLPVQLSSFTVTKKDHTGLLEWITTHEESASRFVIEKSTDGILYTSIGEVEAAGTSSMAQHYQFTDNQLVNGNNYYRLKIVDVDGKFSHSPVRLLTVTATELVITVYPNPVRKGILYINTSSNCERVTITDVSGRILRTVATTGTQQEIPVHSLAKGTYIVTVMTDAGKKVQKIVIE